MGTKQRLNEKKENWNNKDVHIKQDNNEDYNEDDHNKTYFYVKLLLLKVRPSTDILSSKSEVSNRKQYCR